MAFDYNKLRGKIVEVFKRQSSFAQAMEWSERTLSLKLNSKRSWKQPEICKAIRLLGLCGEDIEEYFFKEEVQNIERGREDS